MDVLLHQAHLFHLSALALEELDRFLNQLIGNRSALSDSDAGNSVQPFWIDAAVVIDQMSRLSQRTRDLYQLIGILAVLRADHQYQLDLLRQLLHRVLAVLRRVADVLFRRRNHSWKTPLQHIDNLSRVIDT